MFTNIIADMTVYAFYSTGYTVTLQSGIGYTLAAQPGSVSPVKEGGNFRFGVTISSGYEKTDSFAVSVNGQTIMPAADGVYTIANIMENKVVTVDGVQKRKAADDSDRDEDEKSDGQTENGGGSGDGTDLGGTTNLDSGAVPGGSTNPGSGKAPVGSTNPGNGEALVGSTNPDGGKAPVGSANLNSGIASDGGKTADNSGNPVEEADLHDGTKPDGEKKLIEPVAVGKTQKTVTIPLDEGMVIVTVNNMDEALCTAQVVDAMAVVNAVLSEQQIAQVSQGETVEIRIDVKRIDEAVSQTEHELAEQGVEELRRRISNLEIGMYVDISMFVRVGESEWNAVNETGEAIDIIIDVPEELQDYAADFYIVRIHEGAFTLLEDLDDKAETITIQTSMFSVYAIAYAVKDGSSTDVKCGLCHICPTFLGICCFIWLAVIVVAVMTVILLLRRRKKKEENKKSGGEV